MTIMFALALFSCQEDEISTTATDDKTEITEETIANSIKGTVRIKLTSDVVDELSVSLKSGNLQTSVSNIDSVMDKIGATSFKRTFPYSGKYEQRTKAAGLDLWYDVEYDTLSTELATVLKKFNALSEVNTTESIRKIKNDAIAQRKFNASSYIASLKSSRSDDYPYDDTYLSYQWHYNNTGSITDSEEGSDINLFNAWDMQTGSEDVIVAVVDGGIDYDHPDIADNMWVNESESSDNSDDDNNGYTDDIYGYNFVENSGTIVAHDHGTHVAGTIGARNGNSTGVCGIAGGDANNVGVKLMSCQVFEPNTSDPNGDDLSAEDFEAAIKYGADNGAVICQCSWGYDGATYLPESMKEAIDYFIEYAGYDEDGNQTGPMAGGIVIFAAGNDATSTDAYPAMYDQVVAVGACGADYTLASYSNYGSWIDIMAPGGEDAWTSNTDNEYVLSTCAASSEGNYAWMVGTSQACPQVSGVAALIISEYGGEGFTPDDLKAKLYHGATDLDGYNSGYENMMGVGLINAAAALKDDDTNTTPTVTAIDDLYMGNPDSTYTIELDDYFSDEDGDELSYTLDYSSSMVTASVAGQTLNLTPASYGLSTITITGSDYLDAEVSTSFQIMMRNDSTMIDVYPNPVTDVVNLRMGEDVDGTLNVKVYNSNGVVKDIQNVSISTFSPASMDLSGLSSGSYVLKMTYENQECKKDIIKL